MHPRIRLCASLALGRGQISRAGRGIPAVFIVQSKKPVGHDRTVGTTGRLAKQQSLGSPDDVLVTS